MNFNVTIGDCRPCPEELLIIRDQNGMRNAMVKFLELEATQLVIVEDFINITGLHSGIEFENKDSNVEIAIVLQREVDILYVIQDYNGLTTSNKLKVDNFLNLLETLLNTVGS